VRLLSVGRLIHWKGYHLALEAFARLKSRFPQATYWVIGDGPERRRLAALAGRLRLRSSVRFLGSLPRGRTLAQLARGDVLVHPSLHESGGWACVEAMACGLPVVCLQIGGPAVLISEECGILVPAASPGQAVEQMAGALEKLARDGRLRRAMGEAGRTRARELFNWDGKGKALQGFYRQCAGSGKAGGK
jgi:glycosyltransferase involved in cell wall biosynthesis